MKQMRIPLLITWVIAIVGIVLGSFFDLQISQAIASDTKVVALLISAIVPTLGFGAVAAMGGGFIAFIVKGKYHIVLKILFGVLALACFFVSIKYPGTEYFGINGFYEVLPEWVGYLVVILPEAMFAVGGYFLFRNVENKRMWIIFCIIIVLLLIALLGVIPTIKDNMHRPRFRFLVKDHLDMYKNWWEPFKEYKQYVTDNPLEPHDNFKSYPSGHTAEAAILIVAATFFPLADKKLERIQLPLFLGACAVVLVVAVARIAAAAHFLSDVSFGAFIMITLALIGNEIVRWIKPLHIQEEAKAE